MGSCLPSGSWILNCSYTRGKETSTFPQLPAHTSEDTQEKAQQCQLPDTGRKDTEARLREIEIYFFCCIFQAAHGPFRHNASLGSSESPDSLLPTLLARARPSRPGAQAQPAVLGTWEILYRSQQALTPRLVHRGAGHAGKPESQPHPFSYGPLATRGKAVPLESSSAELPQTTWSPGLRAWHGTCPVEPQL